MNFKSTVNIFKENQFILYSQIVDKIFYFLFFAILARLLDFKLFGSIIVVFTFANLVVMLFSFGFPIYLQREAAIQKSNISNLFTLLFSSNLLLSVPYIFISCVLFSFLYPDIEPQLFVFMILIVITSSNEYLLMSLLKGLKKYNSIFVITFAVRLITSFLSFIFWVNDYSSNIIIYVFLLGNLLLLFSIFFASKQYFKLSHIFKINFKSLLSLFVVISPIWFAMLFNFLYDKVDIFIISKIVNFEQLSFYSIAYGVLKSSTISFNFLLIGGLSRVASFTEKKNGVRFFLITYSKLLIVISVMIFLILIVGAKDLLVLFYTDKYINSVYILQVLSFAIIPLSLNNLTGVAMNGVGLYKENMYVTIFGFLFNLIANIIIIPIYGIIGAAYITIITELLILFGDLHFLKLKNKI